MSRFQVIVSGLLATVVAVIGIALSSPGSAAETPAPSPTPWARISDGGPTAP